MLLWRAMIFPILKEIVFCSETFDIIQGSQKPPSEPCDPLSSSYVNLPLHIYATVRDPSLKIIMSSRHRLKAIFLRARIRDFAAPVGTHLNSVCLQATKYRLLTRIHP